MQRLVKTLFVFLFAAVASAVYAAEEQAIVNELKINVRGQPSLIGEVVTQLQKGEPVNVLEYVQTERPKPGEPTNWARIKLPSNTPVWVYAPLIKEGAVSASRLNLRAGPGDNYSVIGRLNKGDKINQIRTMGDWVEIEAPPGAYAFVDATLIKPSGGGVPPVAAATAAAEGTKVPASPALAHSPATPPTSVVEPKETVATEVKPPAPAIQRPQPVQDALAPPIQSRPVVESTPPPLIAPQVAAATTAASPTPAPPVQLPKVAPVGAGSVAARDEAPATKRIVRREGIVRATRSIQAPTWYELVHPETKKTIDYLHEEKMGINLKQYKGQKIVVSGEEAIDPRWPSTPILELETLDIAP